MGVAQEMYQKYLDAEAAILRGQKVQWGDRQLTRADLAEVRAGRQEWETKAQAEKSQEQGRTGRAPIYLRF